MGPLAFSAKTDSSLMALVRQYATFIKSHPTVDLESLAWTLAMKRSTYSIRTFFAGTTRQRVLSLMDKAVETAEAGATFGVQRHPVNANEIPGTLGIFTGQGAQWAEMGKHLILGCRMFRESIKNCEKSLATLPDAPDWSLTQEIFASKDSSRITEAAMSQPICTAIQLAMINLIQAIGIKLNAVIGHSFGEIAATYAAGIISLRDAIRIAYYRGYNAKYAKGIRGKPKAMMAVGLTLDSAITFCARAQFFGRICVAANNAPAIVTLSGDKDAIYEAKGIFDVEKTFARSLNVDITYYSHYMLPCSEPYLKSLKACDISINPLREDYIWISSVRGDAKLLKGTLETLKGQYWLDNMVSPVLFSQVVECSLWNGGPFNMVIELGPHPALKGAVMQTIKSTTGISPPYAGLMQRGDDNIETFSGAIGYIWSYLGPGMVDFEGYRKAFVEFDTPNPKVLKDLPSYPWDHKKIHWKESRISRNFRLRNDQPHELLGRRVPDDFKDEMRWRNVLRLNELPWLRGHEFQQQVLFPSAGFVAMALEVTKQIAGDRPIKLVEIRDLSIFRALVVPENSAGAETVFSVRMVNGKDYKPVDSIFQADFSCHACVDETNGSLEKRCDGRLMIHFGQPSTNELPSRTPGRSKGAPMDMQRFFATLVDLGLNYQGLFKRLKSVNRKLAYALGSASWSKVELGHQHVLHPAFLDSAFQAVFAAFASPTSGVLWAPYLPVKIRRVTMDPHVGYADHQEEIGFEVEAFINESSPRFVDGDVHLYNSQGSTGVQIEGLELKSLIEPQASSDRLLFAETRWNVDTLDGFARALEQQDEATDFELVDAIERTALHYSQEALDALKPEDLPRLEWFHQRMFEAVNAILSSVRKGAHPVVSKEWLEDSRETILSLKSRFPGQVDLKLMNAIGQNLVSVLHGDTQLLEVMLQDDMLNRFYMEGCGFKYLNNYIARAIKQIAFKHPHAKILEIGAGIGGTTKSILNEIKDAYSAYTYTDISSGFFEKAAEKFANSRSKLIFKILDIEKDVAKQGLKSQSYNIIVASNVLYAMRKLSETMQNTRSLLKPGGYLLLVEVTGDFLRMPFLMGGLPGWWLGVDEGRWLGPGISPMQWDELLLATGFSNIDNIVHDMPNFVRHSCSIIISQAVDDKFNLLRDPLSNIEMIPKEENILIIGGKTLSINRKIREIVKSLYFWKDQITIVSSVNELNKRHLTLTPFIICLTKLNKPQFSDVMTSQRIASLQDLFSQSTNILWITAGRLSENPLSNMSIGIGRALITELPHLNLQFMDVSSVATLSPLRVSETFLRLALVASPEYVEYDALWTVEPEVVIEGETMLIPRIMMDKTRNDRLNASRHYIPHIISTDEIAVELMRSGESHTLRSKPTSLHTPSLGCSKLQAKYVVNLSCKSELSLFLYVGTIQGTE